VWSVELHEGTNGDDGTPCEIPASGHLGHKCGSVSSDTNGCLRHRQNAGSSLELQLPSCAGDSVMAWDNDPWYGKNVGDWIIAQPSSASHGRMQYTD